MIPACAPGDVVWGPDPYHGDDPLLLGHAFRPWLVLNNQSFPGHGRQYLCCALTSGTGPASFMVVQTSDWVRGHLGKTAAVDTETVVTIKHHWISRKGGALRREILQGARAKIRSYLN